VEKLMTGSASAPPEPQVTHVKAGEGIALWVPEEPPSELVDGEEPELSTYTFVATAQSTGGALAIAHAVVPPGNGPPEHAHEDADESFYVIGGRTWMRAGGREFTLEQGDYVFVPRGTPHTFKNSTQEPCRMILTYTPGGMEQFFIEIGRTATAGEPAPRLTAEDIRRSERAAARRFGRPR
jgi:quercetin dioxygenase-like cupin family protein